MKSTNPQVEFVSQLHYLCSSQAVELFMLVVEVLLEWRVVDLPDSHKAILFISLMHDTTTNNESLYNVYVPVPRPDFNILNEIFFPQLYI